MIVAFLANKIKLRHMYKTLQMVLSGMIVFSFLTAGIARAQKNSPSPYHQLEEKLKNDYLELGMVIQVNGDFLIGESDTPAQRGLSIPNARLSARGKLDQSFGYKLQVDIADNPILVDAQVQYAYNEMLQVTAGAQKPGVSAEYLTGPGNTDFINRSQIVKALVQNRDLGVRVHGMLSNIQYSVGMFNGNRLAANDNNSFYYATRLANVQNIGEKGSFELGLNAAYGNNSDSRIGTGLLPNIQGKRTVFGGDIRLESGPVLLSSEILFSALEYIPGNDDEVSGFHVTAGYWLTPDVTALIRLDHIQSDQISSIDRDLLILGSNFFPSSQTKIQINYAVFLNDSAFNEHQVLMNFQIAF